MIGIGGIRKLFAVGCLMRKYLEGGFTYRRSVLSDEFMNEESGANGDPLDRRSEADPGPEFWRLIWYWREK